MLSRFVRILNLDGSVACQQKLIERFAPIVVDLKNIGPKVRLWSDQKTNDVIRRVLRQELQHSVTFLGSGDFHHISHLLIEQFKEPITVIIFDHHPDWDILPPKYGCGAWVNRILEQSNVTKVISLGMASDDLGFPSLMTANLRALTHDRLEMYPWSGPNSKVFFRSVPPNCSLEADKGFLSHKIAWKGMRGKDPNKFFLELLPHIPTKKVYVSIDKDCLSKNAALTNWEEGRMPLTGLLACLAAIKENLDIVGLDVTGDYSPPVFSGPMKRFCSLLDHPKNFSAKEKTEDAITKVNEETNLAILDVLF